MAENQRFSLRIPWATLLKIIAAVALVAVLVRIWYILTLIVIAIIVAVGLYPAVLWLERRRWSRSAAASVVVLTLLGLIVAFLAITWSSIMARRRTSCSISSGPSANSPRSCRSRSRKRCSG